MRPIAAFRHMMASSVQIAPRSGVDAFGKPTYGTAVVYRAKIYYRGKFLGADRTPAGQGIAPRRMMHLDTATPILPTAQVTLSTGDVGSTEAWAIHPLITDVERFYDAGGAHSTMVYLAAALSITIARLLS